MQLIAWPKSYDEIRQPGLAVCLSGGGFRSFSCAIGQFRGLYELGRIDDVDLISGVSGGAWFASVHSFANPGAGIRAFLGESLPTDKLTLESLDRISPDFVGEPITGLSAISCAARLMLDGMPTGKILAEALHQEILAPLGLERTLAMANSPWEKEDLLRRNPELIHSIAVPQAGRPRFVASASLGFGRGDDSQFYPLEIEPGRAIVSDLPTSVGAVESLALASNLGPELPGVFHAELQGVGFGLAELWAATGGAPAGLLVGLARALDLSVWDMVPHLGNWLGKDAYLVDGGYVENTGVLTALRRGARKLVVFVNQRSTFGSISPMHVDGIEGQVAHLFGKNPPFGMYSNSRVHLFPEEEFEDIKLDFQIAVTLGDLPWSLNEHTIREENGFDIAPGKVKILWVLNEIPEKWASELPTETSMVMRALNKIGGAPHTSVIHGEGGQMFRMSAAQVQFTAHLHEHAVRARKNEIDELLAWEPHSG